MAIMEATELVLDHRFDPMSCRHYVNGQVSVLHCHHYAALYTQLAMDCSMLDAKQLLADSAEDAYYEVLTSYYRKHDIADLQDRLTIAEQYYAASGLGQMRVMCAGGDAGEVELTHSHVDEGWLKKWGPSDKPVNYITAGFIAGLFAAAFDLPRRSFKVTETASIVAGSPKSRFNVVSN